MTLNKCYKKFQVSILREKIQDWMQHVGHLPALIIYAYAEIFIRLKEEVSKFNRIKRLLFFYFCSSLHQRVLGSYIKCRSVEIYAMEWAATILSQLLCLVNGTVAKLFKSACNWPTCLMTKWLPPQNID